MLLEQTQPALNGAGSTTTLAERFREVRSFTEKLCRPLKTEDYVVQSMTDVSPTKWHLAHTTWFFETFLLRELVSDYRPFHPEYAFLFNSYYVQAGERHARHHRGQLTRPTVAEVYDYRAYVDEHMVRLLSERPDEFDGGRDCVLEIGLNHEQQHQELLLTDIKHVLSVNPLYPTYDELPMPAVGGHIDVTWSSVEEGLYEIGHTSDRFCYDNEGPRHRRFIQDVAMADRTVTNGEYLEFMRDGGYKRPELWLSEGWAIVEERAWSAPGYWTNRDDEWHQFTFAGLRRVREHDPVHHVSFYEADAFARWAGYRLPTEFEWEVASHRASAGGNFVEEGVLLPIPATGRRLEHLFGNLWEWTGSHYSPYPGYRAAEGAIGEYNGKFMVNQFVLRGGSLATSKSHIRATYRNFFHPPARWQFTGIRLVREGR